MTVKPPTPWSVSTDYVELDCAQILDSKGDPIASDPEGIGPFELEVARRIVACVNACAGVPTERLEKCGKVEIRDLLDKPAPTVD